MSEICQKQNGLILGEIAKKRMLCFWLLNNYRLVRLAVWQCPDTPCARNYFIGRKSRRRNFQLFEKFEMCFEWNEVKWEGIYVTQTINQIRAYTFRYDSSVESLQKSKYFTTISITFCPARLLSLLISKILISILNFLYLNYWLLTTLVWMVDGGRNWWQPGLGTETALYYTVLDSASGLQHWTTPTALNSNCTHFDKVWQRSSQQKERHF